MIFNFKESQGDELDMLLNKYPETSEGVDNIAQEIEDNMCAAALESMTWFEGGEDAQKAFTESAEVQALMEAGKMPKRTFMVLSKNDDLTRISHLASLILARDAKDPLYNALAQNRVKERKIRNQIFAKYKNKAVAIAKHSQRKHMKNKKATPVIRFQ